MMQRMLTSRWQRSRVPLRALIGFAACLAVLTVAPGAAAADKIKVKGQITTAADLNPDYRGRPSPVRLTIYQLASADAFNEADFFSLADSGDDLLGGDLIDKTERTLQPGIEAMEFEEEFDEGARYIGIVAAYRDIEQAQWRGLVELPQKGFFKSFFSRSKMMIELQALAVTVAME